MHKLMIKGLQLVSWMKDHEKTKEGIGIKDFKKQSCTK